MHSFGVGSGCDQILVNEMAKAGRGSSSFVFNNSSELNGLIVTALSKAMQPSLKNCSFSWNNETKETLNEVFRNQSVVLTRLFNKKEAEKLKVKFYSEFDPMTKKEINLEFGVQEFAQVTESEALALFKATVNEMIGKEKESAKRIELSTKYGVICSDTALVGIIK